MTDSQTGSRRVSQSQSMAESSHRENLQVNEELWEEEHSNFVIELMQKIYNSGTMTNNSFSNLQIKKKSLKLFKNFKIRISEESVKRQIKKLKKHTKIYCKLINDEFFQ
ncbi:hypothetical protein LguiB_020450 [Lonicera macranthoides]